MRCTHEQNQRNQIYKRANITSLRDKALSIRAMCGRILSLVVTLYGLLQGVRRTPLFNSGVELQRSLFILFSHNAFPQNLFDMTHTESIVGLCIW